MLPSLYWLGYLNVTEASKAVPVQSNVVDTKTILSLIILYYNQSDLA